MERSFVVMAAYPHPYYTGVVLHGYGPHEGTPDGCLITVAIGHGRVPGMAGCGDEPETLKLSQALGALLGKKVTIEGSGLEKERIVRVEEVGR